MGDKDLPTETIIAVRVNNDKLESTTVEPSRPLRALKERKHGAVPPTQRHDIHACHGGTHAGKWACRLLNASGTASDAPHPRTARTAAILPNLQRRLSNQLKPVDHLFARAAAAGKNMARSSTKTVSRMNACARRAARTTNEAPRVFHINQATATLPIGAGTAWLLLRDGRKVIFRSDGEELWRYCGGTSHGTGHKQYTLLRTRVSGTHNVLLLISTCCGVFHTLWLGVS